MLTALPAHAAFPAHPDTVPQSGKKDLHGTLQEVVVRGKKEKYSKRNNPAVDLMQRIRHNAKLHDPANMPAYSYDKYEKTAIGISDYDPEKDRGLLSKGGKMFRPYIDTSAVTGKTVLNLMLKEKASTRLHGSNPAVDKEVTRGYQSHGIDEIITQENMQTVLEDAFREIDIYNNDIAFLQNRFVSPLSAIGPDFYKYWITDTAWIGADRCVELSFAPRNPESMGFNGKIYVPVGDTTMFVKKVTMRMPKASNLNYVNNIFVSQTFEKDTIGYRHKTLDDVVMEFQIVPGTPVLYGRKTTRYDNFSYTPRPDLEAFYTKLGRWLETDSARKRPEVFWQTARLEPLTRPQRQMPLLMRNVRKVPLFYWGEKVFKLLESGYVRTGNPSKFDFGPLNTLVSFNDVEGVRLRAGGMTMAPLNPHLFAKGFVAYGTKDHRWKYNAHLEYSFTKKKRHSYEWPRHGFYATASYDLDMLGQHYLFTNSDNIFLSLKRKEATLVTYRRLFEGGYVLELPNNFSVSAALRHERQESTRWLPFIRTDGSVMPNFTQNAFALTLRYAPGERFVQGRTTRMPVNMDAWVLQLTHEYGPKGLWGAPFTLNRTELSVQKRFWFSAFGYVNITAKAGKIWDAVYYPALMWPNANLSYTIQPESYSLMNPMEFANDHYAALDLDYFGNGILFNRLPLIKKLHLREAFTFKGLMGGLTKRNNPAYNKDILLFPEDAHSRVMSRTPYMEIGCGIDNILTVLRVDYVWRLTYLDTPGIDKNGVRVSLHFSF